LYLTFVLPSKRRNFDSRMRACHIIIAAGCLASVDSFIPIKNKRALLQSPRLAAAEPTVAENSVYLQDKLLQVLGHFNKDEETLPCGLECNDEEKELVNDIISDLIMLEDSREPTESRNLVRVGMGKVQVSDILGTWDLLYTSSRIIKSNKSLSGLGYTSSDLSQFASLSQKITGNQFLGFIEFVETFQNVKDGSLAFEVTITGEWQLEDRYNDPYTGSPATTIRIDPEKVKYGVSENDGESWASLGPIKLLNICFLTEDLQIARGIANPESVFVFQKRQCE